LSLSRFSKNKQNKKKYSVFFELGLEFKNKRKENMMKRESLSLVRSTAQVMANIRGVGVFKPEDAVKLRMQIDRLTASTVKTQLQTNAN
jgi:hypothetical protein